MSDIRLGYSKREDVLSVFSSCSSIHQGFALSCDFNDEWRVVFGFFRDGKRTGGESCSGWKRVSHERNFILAPEFVDRLSHIQFAPKKVFEKFAFSDQFSYHHKLNNRQLSNGVTRREGSGWYKDEYGLEYGVREFVGEVEPSEHTKHSNRKYVLVITYSIPNNLQDSLYIEAE